MKKQAGVKVYSHLRSRVDKSKFSHRRMFGALADDESKLLLLNFLYANGGGNPFRYKERFGKYFGKSKLNFISKEEGFELVTAKEPGDQETDEISMK